MEGETLTFADWSEGEGPPPLDAADDPDRWQPLLPMPYRMVDELLTETLDAAMFLMHLKAEARRKLNPAQIVDDESGAAAVSPPLISVPLPADLGTAPITLLCHLDDGAVAAALEALEDAGAASLWLWDVEATVQEAQQVATLAPGLRPCQLLCYPMPAAHGGKGRQRLLLLSATAEPPAEEGGERPSPAEDAAKLLVLDVGPSAEEGGGWDVITVADLPLRSFAAGHIEAQLAVDVRHLTISLEDGTLLAYRLPAPTRPAPLLVEASGQGLGAKGGGEAKAGPSGVQTISGLAPLWSVPPPPATDSPAAADAAADATDADAANTRVGELVTPPAWVQPHAHFLLTPAPRTMSDPLSWVACGVLWWRRTEACMTQSLWATGGGREAAEAAAEAEAEGGKLAGPPSPLTWQLPHRPTASACSADSTVIATGLEDGSVVVWDTGLRSERLVLQKHAAPVTHVVLQPGAGKKMLLSLAEDCTLHCYDISADAETGQGKLVFRRRLPADLAPTWLRFAASVPLILLADTACVRTFDCNGELIATLQPDAGYDLRLASRGACAYSDAARVQLLCLQTAKKGVKAKWGRASNSVLDALDAAAAAAAAAEAEAAGEEGLDSPTRGSPPLSPTAAPPTSTMRLARYSCPLTLLCAYPAMAEQLGPDPSNSQLRQTLARFTHAQRLDEASFAADPTLPDGGTLGSRSRKASSSRVGGRSSSNGRRRPRGSGSAGGSSYGGDSAVAGVARSAMSIASGGISEKAMAARDQSSAGGGGSVAGASFMSGGGSRCSSRRPGSEAGMSMRSGGTGSVGGSMQSSVTGLSGDGGKSGEYPDIVGRVQQQQRTRMKGRYARETRVQRRWAELKTDALEKMQQQQQQQKQQQAPPVR